ncbi:hypothetical protein BG005_000132 [Podila minutissima]|nr:hypothetical protein BG005_000132 [Podila minutissima]
MNQALPRRPKDLRRLLYVNKFYFNAAVRLPYYNPLKHWTNHCKPGPEQNPNYSGITLKPAKFHALMLASYGLQLPDKIELPLIQDAARGVSPTTIDYSRTESTLHPLKHNTEDCGWTSDDSDDGLDPDSYENISLSSLNEDQFLPPADRCYKLRTVNLWHWHVGQKHINQGVAFIKAIQAAFPKKPLQIKFPDDDLYNFSTGDDCNPISRFYDMAGNIVLNSLIKFMDRDSYRLLYGNSPKQAAFLQLCDNLKVLELSVHHPDSFSWAVEKNPAGGTPRRSGNFLRNMEQLTVNMDTSLTVAHDAVTALENTCSISRSLSLQLEAESGIYINRMDQCPNLENAWIKARRTLSWLFRPSERIEFTSPVYPSPVWKLPRLRSLSLFCKAAIVLDFDSLEHMPALEELAMIVEGEDD